jgi:hypothetical protein
MRSKLHSPHCRFFQNGEVFGEKKAIEEEDAAAWEVLF